MFRLSFIGLLIFLVAFPAPLHAATSISEVEDMVEELTTSRFFDPELFMRYKEYKDQSEQVVTYTVSPGDTLFSIATSFGVSMATISESNNIDNPHLIHPGLELVFPEITGLLYTVEEDDELATICEEYKVDDKSVWFANGLESWDLEPGTELILPGANLPSLPRRVVKRSGAAQGSEVSTPSFIWPLRGRVSSVFGWRDRGFHSGLDVVGNIGDPIRSAAAGTVVASGWRGSYGYMVQIQHNSRVSTLYAHASQLLVKQGDSVEQGQQIARVGSTGVSTGPHLHFEVRINGEHVDPRALLP